MPSMCSIQAQFSAPHNPLQTARLAVACPSGTVVIQVFGILQTQATSNPSDILLDQKLIGELIGPLGFLNTTWEASQTKTKQGPEILYRS